MNNLEFAITMELDGENYYAKQAELNKENDLNAIFLMLANGEKNHATILQKKSKGLSYELKDNNIISESKNVFSRLKAKNEMNAMLSQLDLYRVALEIENQSIDLYESFLSKASNEKEKELFEYLVGQEEVHFAILEDLILLINRPEEWVESAEFGIREEY